MTVGSIEYTATADLIIGVDFIEIGSDTIPSLGQPVLIDGVFVTSLQDLCITKARAYAINGNEDRREKDF